MRRWRALRLRRGAFFGGAASSPVAPVPPPQPIRQAGSRPRLGARLLPAARRRFDPGWGQASQGQPLASFTRQAGSRARPFGARLRHGVFLFVPPPFVSAVPPQPIRGSRSARAPMRVPRGRLWGPPIPQGSQGQAWPCFARPRVQAAVRPRRGCFFAVPQASLALPPPQMIRGARPRPPMRAPRGRIMCPVLGQANQGAAFASFTRQAGTRARFGTRQSRGRRLDPGWGQSAVTVPQQGTASVVNAPSATATITNSAAWTVTIVNDA